MSYSTSYLSSPDQPSVVFPDRLIRPLPKRTLKSRLSQEAASSIEYPPAPPSSGLPNYAHYGESGEFLSDSKVLVQNGEVYDDHDHYHDHDDDHCPHHHHHHCHHDEEEDEVESGDDASPVAPRNAASHRSPPRSPRTARHSRSYGSSGGRGSISGPDGYEAFENTNNKKKRKIPTSGSLSLHHSSLTNELAQLGINANKDGSADDHAGHSMAGSSGFGVQGAGRGHYARKSAARRPLGVSVNGSNLRSGTAKYDQNMAANAKAEDSKDQGIISAAIANATALLRKPLGKGQENVGVLDQQSKQVAANSQFTFTCESDSKGVTFPEQSLYSPSYTQRSGHLPPPGASGGGQRSAHSQNPQATSNAAVQPPQQAPTAQGSAAGKKPRRRRGDVYTLAARQRKLQQEYTNIQRPPQPEDIWICEFCEYESIFGQPPRALIRQYEIKDRKERRRLAEKKRLLDKARRRGKKAAKSTKNGNKNANHAAQTPAHQQEYDSQPLDQLGDDDLEYPYDEDPEPMAEGAPAAGLQPATASNDIAGKGGGTGDGGGVR